MSGATVAPTVAKTQPARAAQPPEAARAKSPAKSHGLAAAMAASPAGIRADPPAQPRFTANPPIVLQPELAIGAVDDPLEREADTVAEKVMRMGVRPPPISAAGPQIARKCEQCQKEDGQHETETKSGAAVELGVEAPAIARAASSPTTLYRKYEKCEREEDEQKLQMQFAGAAKPSGHAPPIVHDVLGSSGQALDAGSRGFFEQRFGRDFGQVRVHADPRAAKSARAIGARAYTSGNHIAFAAGEYAPRTSHGQRLLAHELAHVVQQRSSPAFGVVQRQTSQAAPLLKPGDDITIAIYALTTDATPDHTYSRTYRINPHGAIVVPNGPDSATIAVAGASPSDAAQKIADGLVAAELFRGPRVCVTGPGMAAPACADAKSAMSPEVARAYASFLAYIKGITEPAAAVSRYYQWINAHTKDPAFLRIAPPELWAHTLREPERPEDPTAQQTDRWIRFMKDRLAENAKLSGDERARATEALSRLQDYYDKHHADRDFAKADPTKIYADITVALIRGSVEETAKKKIEADKEAAAHSPEAITAKSAKFDEFLSKAMKLWGYSSRAFPYSIPVDSEGKDILVTGDPALQRVLNALAEDLMSWASHHLSDGDFATASVNGILLNLLQGGYSGKIAEAQHHPLQHETIDRNELLGKQVFASFAESLGYGLIGVAVVGLFVGAEIITAGQATWLLVGVAGAKGMDFLFHTS